MNTENNILIAEFLGFQKTDLGWFDNEGGLIDYEQDNCFDSLSFDTDWNWLMACLTRIGETKNTVFTISENHCQIENDSKRFTKTDYGNLGSVYEACLDYIKWFNKQGNEK